MTNHKALIAEARACHAKNTDPNEVMDRSDFAEQHKNLAEMVVRLTDALEEADAELDLEWGCSNKSTALSAGPIKIGTRDESERVPGTDSAVKFACGKPESP